MPEQAIRVLSREDNGTTISTCHTQTMKPHRGTLILVLGILSIVICGFLGIPAWIMGKNDLAAMDAGQMDPAGRSVTNAGKICGIIGTVLLILGLVVGVLAFALGMLGSLAGARH